MVGVAISFWSNIPRVYAGLLGIAVGTAAVFLARKTGLQFDPSEATTSDKRRFLGVAVFSCLLTSLLILPMLMLFFPDIAVFSYMAGLSLPIAIGVSLLYWKFK